MQTDTEMPAGPRWMYQTTGELKEAVEAYLLCDPLTRDHIKLLRNYLRDWIARPEFAGSAVDNLRMRCDGLWSRKAIDSWLFEALLAGVDPL